MSFLAPFFLLGAAAVAVPVLFHLIRRTTRERTVFSSLLFLLPSPPRLTRRSRLEHILLLLLRCGVLCLLALGFARPFIKKPVSPDAPAAARRLLLLVDTSASMRRANLWADARAKAESILRQTSAADQVAIFTFDQQAAPVMTFEQWNAAPAGERVALAVRKLADTAPGWSGTHLGHALISAAETLADTAGKPATGRSQIVLISDLQEGSRLEPLQGYEWPKGIELSVEPVKARHTGNASLQLVADADEAEPQPNAAALREPAAARNWNSALRLRVRVNNAADSRREQFKVGWSAPDGHGFAAPPTEIYVPPGQSRIVALELPATGPAGESITLQGDDEDFDNTVFVVPPETSRLTVLYCGGESQTDPKQPLYFLQRAFQKTRRQAVQVLVRPPGAPLPPNEVQSAAVFVITDSLPEDVARTLHGQAAAGKTLLFILKREEAARTLAQLVGLDQLSAEEASPNNYAMLAEIDFRHPLFAPFADPRFSDFTKIHFWKYRRLDAAALPGARVVARFDSGDPALLEVPVGKGRVLVLTSGWQPEDSQLALSTKFVPLLYSLLEQSGAPAPSPVQYHVGEAVTLASTASIRAPDGSEIQQAAGETNFSRTWMPGIYTLGSTPPRRFAVNLDAAESRTAPLPLDELERLGAPVSRLSPVRARDTGSKVRLQTAELESRQKLWRWFLAATLGMLLLETWLAGRTARRSVAQAETATGNA